ncbi:hypothetical protein RI367_007387, partial [Sorochytrium milnesiophthora]
MTTTTAGPVADEALPQSQQPLFGDDHELPDTSPLEFSTPPTSVDAASLDVVVMSETRPVHTKSDAPSVARIGSEERSFASASRLTSLHMSPIVALDPPMSHTMSQLDVVNVQAAKARANSESDSNLKGLTPMLALPTQPVVPLLIGDSSRRHNDEQQHDEDDILSLDSGADTILLDHPAGEKPADTSHTSEGTTHTPEFADQSFCIPGSLESWVEETAMDTESSQSLAPTLLPSSVSTPQTTATEATSAATAETVPANRTPVLLSPTKPSTKQAYSVPIAVTAPETKAEKGSSDVLGSLPRPKRALQGGALRSSLLSTRLISKPSSPAVTVGVFGGRIRWNQGESLEETQLPLQQPATVSGADEATQLAAGSTETQSQTQLPPTAKSPGRPTVAAEQVVVLSSDEDSASVDKQPSSSKPTPPARSPTIVINIEAPPRGKKRKLTSPNDRAGHAGVDKGNDSSSSGDEADNPLDLDYSTQSLMQFPLFPAVQTRSQRLKHRKQTVTKKCSHCGTTVAPAWRNGPAGPETLCGKCGKHYRLHGFLPMGTKKNKQRARPTEETVPEEESVAQPVLQDTPAPPSKRPREDSSPIIAIERDSRGHDRAVNVVPDIETTVWAKWAEDNFYYPAVITDYVEPAVCMVRFLDGDTERCPVADVRPYRLEPGDHVFAHRSNSEMFAATVNKLLPDGKRYSVTFADNDLQRDVSFEHVLLSAKQMLEWESKYYRRPLPVDGHRTPPQATRSPSPVVIITTPTARSVPLSKRAKTNDAQTPDIEEPPPSPTPRKPPRPTTARTRATRKTKSGMPAAAVKQAAVRSVSSAADAVKAPNGQASRNLFDGMEFLLTTIRTDVFSPQADNSEPHDLLNPTVGDQSREGIQQLIVRHGGVVRHDLKKVVADCRERAAGPTLKRYCLASGPTRTLKYLAALALGLPRVSHRWILDCIERNEVVSYKFYQLSNGMSTELGAYVAAAQRVDLFSSLTFQVLGDPAFKADWAMVLEGGEAKVVLSKKTAESIDYVLSDRMPNKMPEDSIAVTKEWLIQCLINQRILDPYSRAGYQP